MPRTASISKVRIPAAPLPVFGRRKLLWMGCLALLQAATLVGCRSSHPPMTQPPAERPPETPAHLKIRDLTDEIVRLRAAEPALRGFKDHEIIAGNAARGRSPQDIHLLEGRLYYEVLHRLERHAQLPKFPADVLKTAVRDELGKPQPVEKFSKAYFDELLAETKARAARDPDFKAAVDQSAGWVAYPWRDEWNDYACFVDGLRSPIYLCRFLVTFDLFETLDVYAAWR